MNNNTNDYKAAGILPIHCSWDGTLYVLMTLEYRDHGKLCWHVIGGKRKEEIDQSALDTAVREFSEETLNLVSPQDIRNCLRKNGEFVYIAQSKYYLFVTYFDQLEIVSNYAKCRSKLNKNNGLALSWIPLNYLLEYRQHIPLFTDSIPFELYPISSFVDQIIYSFLNNLIVPHIKNVTDYHFSSSFTKYKHPDKDFKRIPHKNK